MAKSLMPLQPGLYYHIYNRGNNREELFYEERNYRYFLKLYTRYIHTIADTYAYCLMRNHFHLLLRIKETSQVSETCEVFKPSRYFSNFFNAYAKAINKAYERTGSLFEERFGRVEITSDAHFVHLVFYIHFNPQKHGFVDDFRDWHWSSYNALCSTGTTKLKRTEVLEWFGGKKQFEEFHRGMIDEKALETLIDEDVP